MRLTPNGLIMLQKSAEAGNPGAQYDLGVMYAFGECVSKDETKAAEWFQKAAMQGNKYAQFELGVLCEFGRGISKDEVKAAEWYQMAAAQGWSRDIGRKSISKKENPSNDKQPNSNEAPSGKDALLVVAAVFAFGFLAAFIGKNYNKELFMFINAALVIGLVYALIKHTKATLAIVVIIAVIAVTGGIVKGCSSRSSYEYEPGPGFR